MDRTVVVLLGIAIAGLIAIAVAAQSTIGPASSRPTANPLVAPPASAARAVPNRAPEARVVRAVSDLWPPYADRATNQRRGYVVDLLEEILAAAGYRVEYRTDPWSRCLEQVRLGHATVAIGAAADEVPGFVLPAQPCGMSGSSFYTLPDSLWTWRGPQSLDEVHVVVAQDYAYGDVLDRALTAREAVGGVSRLQGNDVTWRMIGLVMRQRAEVLIEDPAVVRYTLRRHDLAIDTLRQAGHLEASLPIHVAFSPADPRSRELAQTWDQGLARLRAAGRLAEILAWYGLTDWH